MLIKFQTIEDDYIAFSVFYSRHSPLAKRSRIITGIIIPGFFLTLILSRAIYSNEWASAIVGIVLFGGLALWILAGQSSRVSCTARKLFREGKNKSFFGIHELEVNDYGIRTKSEYGEGKIAWAAVERIGSTPDYTFIFIGANKAITLPKARIIEGDYDTFVTELTSRFSKFATTSSMSPEIKQANILIDQNQVACEDKRAGRHSGYGVASFVIALTSMGVFFLSIIAIVITAIIFEGTAGKDSILFMASAAGILFSCCATFAGTGLGISGLLSKNRKKIFAVIGLILNLLMIFISAMIMIIGRCNS